MKINDKRCVITGLGMVCAVGNSVDECWDNVLHARTGIAHTKTVDTADCYSDYAAEVKCEALDTPETEGMDRVSKLCIKATREAIEDSGLDCFGGDKRVAVIMGSCVGGSVSIAQYYTEEKSAKLIEQMPISVIATQVANVVGAGGVVTNVANACAAGTISIAYASDLIRAGKADVVIAGGADAFASIPYAGFLSLHALADFPCSPFNHSSGLTLGEGSGVVVVESYEHAVKRNAKMYCEVLGSGISSDAHHITAPRPDGAGQMSAIRKAISTSGLAENDIDYINAHGTGTAKNDEAEFLSLHTIFDGKNNHLSVSSTKALTGHCLGAAGAIEAVFAIKALTTGKVPPTVGYGKDDIKALHEKAGDIDFCPNVPKHKDINYVMNNSFAFGGNNASIVFGKSSDSLQKEYVQKEIFVTGIGAVTPLGNGVARYVEAVNGGESISGPASSSVGLSDYDALGLKMAFYRKLDRFSQLQCVSGMQALVDGGYAVTDDNSSDIGIIVGSCEGALGMSCDFETTIAVKGNAAGSAFKFPNTVYNAAGGYLSICSGVKGYNVTVTNGAQSGLFGIAYAVNIIRSGEEEAALACGTDENNEIITELYSGLDYVSPDKVTPYNFDSDKFTLSDGSVTLLVESGDSAAKRGAEKYCRVAGYGASHGKADVRSIGDAKSLEQAVLDAVADAGMTVSDIDAVVGFGNGNKNIDGVELEAYIEVFGDNVADIPVITVKDRMGEGRAATAAMGAMHAALMLHGDIPTEKHAYRIENGKAVKTVVDSKKLNNILVTSYGLGGTFCAVVLTK
ncbi:MAG: beta-ketoacyl-[acyl-carrier-protein] synthase family protein [Clostridiales bacterium]|nr:beta-ketoacyl-[acyl-carrier-protein] synthase family protein [Clostridiales bacterium]